MDAKNTGKDGQREEKPYEGNRVFIDWIKLRLLSENAFNISLSSCLLAEYVHRADTPHHRETFVG